MTRRAALVAVGLGAFAVFGVESIAWPISLGRDGNDYIVYYAQLWHHTVFPEVMLSRTPIAPLVIGIPLRLGGAVAAEAVFGVLYAVTIVAVVAAALRLDRRLGVATAVALLLYVPLGALFHTLSSDAPSACGFAILMLLAVCAAQRPNLWRFTVVGLAAGLLVLIRPSNQVLGLVATLPLLVVLPWRTRLGLTGAAAAAFIVVVAGWAGVNDARYGDFTVYRLGPAAMPFYRLYLSDRLIRPDNGPASRALAAAVEKELLPAQPYRAYHVTLRRFFGQGSDRTWADLVGLSDSTWGWDSDYGKLRAAAFEAIRRRPATYARAVYSTLRIMIDQTYAPPIVRRSPPAALSSVSGPGDQLIPSARLPIRFTTPDSRIQLDWNMPTHPRIVFTRRADAVAYAALVARVEQLQRDVPARNGSPAAARMLDQIAGWYPPVAFWLLVGAAGLLLRRGRRLLLPTFLAFVGLAVFVGVELGVSGTVEYRLPFDAAFVFFGLAGLFGAAPRR